MTFKWLQCLIMLPLLVGILGNKITESWGKCFFTSPTEIYPLSLRTEQVSHWSQACLSTLSNVICVVIKINSSAAVLFSRPKS